MANDFLSLPAVSGVESMAQTRVDHAKSALQGGDIKKAALEFESYFLSYLMKEMYKTIQKGGLFDNPKGEMYQSFYFDEIARRSAEAGGIGFANMVVSSLADPSTASNVLSGKETENNSGQKHRNLPDGR